jgi:trehalose-phosphatase
MTSVQQTGAMVDRALEEALAAAAAAPVLLVASDFDGTLSDIAPRPELARGCDHDLAALEALSGMSRTYGLVISGRARSVLGGLLGTRRGLLTCGSHGIEIDPALHVRDLDRRTPDPGLVEAMARIVAEAPGALLERKPFGVAVHYRGCEPDVGARVREAALGVGRGVTDGAVIDGDKVVEVVASATSKGICIRAVRQRLGAAAVVFLGDDATDETVFPELRSPDVGVRIGMVESRASFRVPDRSHVGPVLARLVELRREHLDHTREVPISDHIVLSDQRTLGLLDPLGRISWLCLPRLDAPALFAALLDPGAGEFTVGPERGGPVTEQRYIGDSLVVESRWPDLVVTDYLDCTSGRPFQRAGRCDLLRVIEGTAAATVRFAPRLDFGRLPTRLTVMDWGVRVEGAIDPIILVSPGVRWTVQDDPSGRHHTAVARVDPSSGPVVLELRYGVGSPRAAVLTEPMRRAGTERFWSGWAGTLTLPRTAREAVRRSALTLKALVHGPTGAVAAAATTSLPEQMGGVRNWDYRFCWPRDAALAAASLVRLGNTGVAMKLLDWLGEVVDKAESPERLRPIYTVSGADLPPEGQINELCGYEDSRPVRVSNAASSQVQLDVFGPIVDLIAMLAERGAPVTPQYWRLVEQMVRAVDARWHEPDHGIWEFRAHPRHHVYSKVMCWLAVDRAVRVAEFVRERIPTGWGELRERIREDVLAHGFDKERGAFVCAYDLPEPDASALVVGLSGMVGADDARFAGTVDYVLARLGTERGVYRYLFDDALPGVEGVFHLCTGWAVRSLCLLGREGEARRLFDALLAARGPAGLLSEEIDARTGEPLGNVPQAYSHLAVIDCAVALDGVGAGG